MRVSRELAALTNRNVCGGRFQKNVGQDDVQGNMKRLHASNKTTTTSPVSRNSIMNGVLPNNDALESSCSLQNDDYNVVLSMQCLKKSISANLCFKICAKAKVDESLSSFSSYLSKYERNVKYKANNLKKKGHFCDEAGNYDDSKYLKYLVENHPSPQYHLTMYKMKMAESNKNEGVTPVHLSISSIGVTTTLVASCGKGHSWNIKS